MKQFVAQIESWMVQDEDGEGRFFYRFHFTMEQALDTGEDEEDAGKVLNNHLRGPWLIHFEHHHRFANPPYRSMAHSVICRGQRGNISQELGKQKRSERIWNRRRMSKVNSRPRNCSYDRRSRAHVPAKRYSLAI